MRGFVVVAVVLLMATACRRVWEPIADAAAIRPTERVAVAASHTATSSYCPPASVLAIASPHDFVAALIAVIEPHSGGNAFTQLSETEQTVLTVEQLDHEVRRGGFTGYFNGPVGDHALDALAALRRIAATETASMLERGMAIFGPAGPPRDDAMRQAQIATFGDGTRRFWAALDGVYLRGPDDLDALLRAYVRNTPQAQCPLVPR